MVVGSSMVRNRLDRKSKKAERIKHGLQSIMLGLLPASGGKRDKSRGKKIVTTL